jgi:hypothetical protein
MSEVCKQCGRGTCKPVYFHLCPSCLGEGCPSCSESIVPGIVPGEVDTEIGGNLGVCTEWSDPETDAAIDDQRDSLIGAITICRDNMIADLEDANEAP